MSEDKLLDPEVQKAIAAAFEQGRKAGRSHRKRSFSLADVQETITPKPLNEEEVPTAVKIARRQIEKGGSRKNTITVHRTTLQEMQELKNTEYPTDVERPKTRGDCVDGPRPCPWISCSHHLYLNVSRYGGIKIVNPHVDPWDMKESCALDIADQGGVTMEIAGAHIGVVRERLRQVEDIALAKLESILKNDV